MEHFSIKLNIDTLEKVLKEQFKQKVKIVGDKLQDQAHRIAELVEGDIRAFIASEAQEGGKDSEGTLGDAIALQVDRKGNTVSIFLNEYELSRNPETKYWYVLNYGRKKDGTEFFPPKNVGKFEGGRWIHYGDKGLYEDKNGKTKLKKGFMLLAPHDFTPINYLEFAETRIAEEVGMYLNKLVNGF